MNPGMTQYRDQSVYEPATADQGSEAPIRPPSTTSFQSLRILPDASSAHPQRKTAIVSSFLEPRSDAQLRVERLPDPVPKVVEPNRRHEDGHARQCRDPPRGGEVVLAVRREPAPARH